MNFYSSDHLDGLFRDVVSCIILEFGLKAASLDSAGRKFDMNWFLYACFTAPSLLVPCGRARP